MSKFCYPMFFVKLDFKEMAFSGCKRHSYDRRRRNLKSLILPVITIFEKCIINGGYINQPFLSDAISLSVNLIKTILILKLDETRFPVCHAYMCEGLNLKGQFSMYNRLV